MNRPSGELRLQYDDLYVTSSRIRALPRPGRSQPAPYVFVDASGSLLIHIRGSVAVPQSNIAIALSRFTARQPVVASCAVCAATSAEMPGVHVVGAPSGGIN